MTAQVVVVTEHIAGSELVESPTALYPSMSLYPSAELIPGGGLLYPSETTLSSTTLYPLGAALLEVADVSEFDQDGGQIQIGDETHYYEVLEDVQEDGSGFLQLNDSLTGTYRAGEPVYEYPQVVERWADAIEPNGEEPLRLRVPHALYDKLALGIREDDAGEQVTFAEDGTDHVITDVLGRFPIQDLTSVLLTTSPDGTGQRVEIDDDGIREIEDDDTVAVSLSPGQGLDFAVDTAAGASPSRGIYWKEGDGSQVGRVWSWVEPADPTIGWVQLLVGAPSGSTGAGVLARATNVLGNTEVIAQAGSQFKSLLDATGNSDYELDESIGWQPWTPTFTGWSSNPTGGVYRYKQLGKMVIAVIRQPNDGTSNSVNTSISAPVTAATGTDYQWEAAASARDNGAFLTTPARAGIASGASTITFGKDYSVVVGGWTAANGKRIANCTLIYEAA